MSTYTDIIEQEQRALDAAARPWNEYGQNQIAIALANRARSNQLQDVAATRQFERESQQKQFELSQKAADETLRREKERFAEDERLRAVNEAVKSGVPGVTADDSVEDVASKTRDYIQQRARTGLEIIDAQTKAAQAKQIAAMRGLEDVANETGSLPQVSAALRQTLIDPAARTIPDADRNRMLNTLTKARTPEEIQKAVTDTVMNMQKNYGLIGSVGTALLPNSVSTTTVRQATAFNNAKALYDVFTTNLAAKVDPSKQLMVAARMKQYEDANRQADDLSKQAYAHISANAGLLDNDTVKAWTSKLGPPDNPVSLMPGRTRGPSTRGPSVNPTTGIVDYTGETGALTALGTTPPLSPTDAGPVNISPEGLSQKLVNPVVRPYAGMPTDPNDPNTILAASMAAASRAGWGNTGASTIPPLSAASDPRNPLAFDPSGRPGLGTYWTLLKNAIGNERPDIAPSKPEIQANRLRIDIGTPIRFQEVDQGTPSEQSQIKQLLIASGKVSPDQLTDQAIEASRQKIIASGDMQAFQQARDVWHSLLQQVRAMNSGAAPPTGTFPPALGNLSNPSILGSTPPVPGGYMPVPSYTAPPASFPAPPVPAAAW